MTIATSTKNPFDLPELIHRISRFVTLKDAISCARVSKAWNGAFVSAIWFRIDFNTHPRFADLTPAVVAKNGHHIRIVKNAKTLPQVSIIDSAYVNKLKKIYIDTSASLMQHVLAYETIFRNSLSLEDLDAYAVTAPPNKKDSISHYVSVPALVPSPGITPPTPSKLRVLRIAKLWMTHNGLITILQGCPKLYDMTLVDTEIVGTPTHPYQHNGLRILRSKFDSAFPEPATDPSLLSYFPKLTTLHIWGYKAGEHLSADRVKEVIKRYCPKLTAYNLEGQSTIILDFLINIAETVTVIHFKYNCISLEVITAILLHQATLTTVGQFKFPITLDLENEAVAAVSDHFQASSRFLQLIPRGCPQLEVFDLHSHEMDIDAVEQSEWACKNLRSLRCRVKGLDTKEKILKSIELWRAGCWRRRQKEVATPVSVEEEQDLDEQDLEESTIEVRVARHLLKFEKLSEVWLGYQTWKFV
jgi:hypothetical protein